MDDARDDTTGKRRSAGRPKGRGRRVLRGIGLALLAVVASLVGLVLGLLFTPDEVYRRAAVAIARKALHHDRIELAGLRVRPLSGIELWGLYLGPPPGFRDPLLTVEHVRLRYGLRHLLGKRLDLHELLVLRPTLWLRQRGGKTNWQAFSEQQPEKKKERKRLELPRWTVRIGQIAIRDVAADVLGPDLVAWFGTLGIRLDGVYQAERTHLDLAVDVGSPRPGRANLVVRRGGPQPVQASLDLSARLRAGLRRLEPASGRLEGDLSLRSRRLEAGRPVPPLRLEGRLRARAEGRGGEISDGRLRLNGEELVRLRAALGGRSPGEVLVEVVKLHLPLHRFEPYAALLSPGLRLAGLIEGGPLRVTARIDELRAGRPPKAEGRIGLHGINVRTAEGAHVQDLDGELRFAYRNVVGESEGPKQLLGRLPERAGAWPAGIGAAGLGTNLRLTAGRLGRGEVSLRGLSVDLTAATGERQRGHDLAARFAVGAARIQTGRPRPARLAARGELAARTEGDRVEVSSLQVDVNRALRASIRGAARDGGRDGLRAHLAVTVDDLGKLADELGLGRLAPGARAGGAALTLDVRGRLPREGERLEPLQTPVHADGSLRLRSLSVATRELSVRAATGDLRLRFRPGRGTVGGTLRARRAEASAQGVRLASLAVPLEAEITEAGVRLRAGVTARDLARPASGLDVDRLRGTARVRVSAPVNDLISTGRGRIRALRVELDGGLRAARQVAGGNRVQIGPASFQARIEGRGGRELELDAQMKLAHAQQPFRGAVVRGLSMTMRGRVRGAAMQVPLRPPSLDSLTGELHARGGIEEVRQPELLDPALRNARFELAAALEPGRRLRLDELRLEAPSHNARASVQGRLGLRTRRPGEPLDLKLLLAFAAPPGGDTAGPRDRAAMSGSMRLRAHLYRIRGERVRVAGRFSADRFGAQARLLARAVRPEGQRVETMRRIAIRDLSADIPFQQDLLLRLQPLAVRPLERGASIFEVERPQLYRAVRQFTSARRNFSISRLSVAERQTAWLKSGERRQNQRGYEVGPVVADVSVRGGVLHVDYLRVHVLGGDLVGALQLQPLGYRPFDVRARLEGRLTQINLAELVPAAARRGKEARIAALAHLKYQMSNRYLDGRIQIEDIDRQGLVDLLTFLDPQAIDPGTQSTKDLLSAWYTRAARPEVEEVAIYVNHSQAKMQIRLDAIEPLGALLRAALSRVRIERLGVGRFLPTRREDNEPREALDIRHRSNGSLGVYHRQTGGDGSQDRAREPDPG